MNSSEIDPASQKLISFFTSFISYFSIVIILFLVISYIGNQYIPGIGLMFFPMWLTLGKSFYKKSCLVSLFHNNEKPNELFTEVKLSNNSESEPETKYAYKLIKMGAYLHEVIGAILGEDIGNIFKSNKNRNKVSDVYVFLQNYDNDIFPWQKFVYILFGALQIFIGLITTLFGSFAYIFRDSHRYFFDIEKEYEKNPDYFIKKDDKILLVSGWTKFYLMISFIPFSIIDKITYGTLFLIGDEKKINPLISGEGNSGDTFKYVCFIIMIMIFIGTLQNTLTGGSAGITFGIIFGILIFLLFKIRIFNDEYQTDPLPNYNSLLKKYSLLIKPDANSAASNAANSAASNAANSVTRNAVNEKPLQKGLKNKINDLMKSK
jgi:hypothetical protein